MKKRLLFSLFMVLAIASCNGNNACDCDKSCDEGTKTSEPSVVRFDNIDGFIDNAYDILNELEYEVINASDEDFLNCFLEFKDAEYEYISTIEDIDAARSLIKKIESDEHEFVRENFAPLVTDKAQSYFDTLMNDYDPRERQRAEQIFENETFPLREHVDTFYQSLTVYGWVINAINNFFNVNTGEGLEYYINEVRFYAEELIGQTIEFVDGDLINQKLEEEINYFDSSKSEEENEELVEQIKNDLYAYTLSLYREALVDSYLQFTDYIDSSIDTDEIKNYVLKWKDDDVAVIRDYYNNTLEKIYKAYEGSLDIINNELSSKIVRYGEDCIYDIWDEYRNKIVDDYDLFHEQYYDCKYRIQYLDYDLETIEDEMFEIIDGYLALAKQCAGETN